MATSSTTTPLRNVLSRSKSLYLLQHKDNPVAWQEFTPATIELAKSLDRPIFLSSGYSACHWCHVLAHESFEDQETADLMNEYFVNVKLDREERPDVDRMYMTYLQATQGGGGWPLSVFMTPDLEPFFAGTYFPNSRFKNLLERIHELWEDDRAQCEEMGKNVIQTLKEMGAGGRAPGSLTTILSTNPAKKVFAHLVQTHDPRYGGFSPGGPRSRGPKFPSCSLTLEPLARIGYHGLQDTPYSQETAVEMAMSFFRAIWKGGVRDQIGGGVARYSVDEKWIVPHFEKMLYDQAQLVSSALDFGQLTEGDDRKLCFDLANDILEYSLRDLRSPEGAFWSAEDADSAHSPGGKKSEGFFYIWSKEEMDKLLGSDAEVVEYHFGVKIDGNVDPIHDSHGEMTGLNILYQAHTIEETATRFELAVSTVAETLSRALKSLKDHRDKRERPGLDDKLLTAWNGLMLSALSRAHTVLPAAYPSQSHCLPAAEDIVRFIRDKMWDPSEGGLYRSYREGRGALAQTDDYAFLIKGLLDLYEACGNDEYMAFAVDLQKRQDELFWDHQGGYFASAPDPHVLVRMKDSQDGAEPSALSVSVHNNSRLSLLASNRFVEYEKRAEDTYLSISHELSQIPRAFGYSVAGLMDLEAGYREFIVTGPADNDLTRSLLAEIQSHFIPNKVLIRIDPASPPVKLAELNDTVQALLREVEPALRICEGGTCGLPITNPQEARRGLTRG